MATKLPGRAPGQERMPGIVSASLLAADGAALGAEAALALAAGADWLHFDLMDGHFVKNWTFGPCVVGAVREALVRRFSGRDAEDARPVFCDCHLYAVNPQDWVEELAQAGASLFTFHLEALWSGPGAPGGGWRREERVVELAKRVRQAGMAAGVALVPQTPAEAVAPYVAAGDVDVVLLLSVEPGFGGQTLQPGALGKAAALRARFPGLHIQMDGGIAPGATAALVAEHGVNIVVSGSGIFKGGPCSGPDACGEQRAMKRRIDGLREPLAQATSQRVLALRDQGREEGW